MCKVVTVLCGFSGTGKTYYRSHYFPNEPYVDVADVYKAKPLISWQSATVLAARQAAELLEDHPHVYIEGYYLPGTPSREILTRTLFQLVPGVHINFMLFWAPSEVCEQRIWAQYYSGEISALDRDERIAMMKRTWKPERAFPGAKVLS